MLCRAAFLVAGITVAGGATLRAQNPDPASRVARAVIDPFPVSFSRGDSLSARFTLVDSVGGDVTGARWDLESSGDAVRYRLLDSSGASRSYLFSADAPASETFRVALHTRSADGREGTRVVDSVTVGVADWAVDRIEIAEPQYDAYTGTTFLLRARVFSTHNTELEDPKISWETDDPCHARVMPDGAIAFGASAKITVKARSQGKEASRQIRVSTNPVQTISISPKSAQTRIGDVVRFRVAAEDRQGQEVRKIALSYTIDPLDSVQRGAHIDDRGYFVAEEPGAYVVRVAAGDVATEALVEVTRRPAASPVRVVGRGPLRGVRSRGLQVFSGKDGRDYAFTGTESGRLYVWDVTDPVRVTLTDSVTFDSASVGDFRISSDGAWAVVGRTGGFGARNGITILDLATPAHPKAIGSLSDSLNGGVSSIWVSSNLVYAVNAGAGALDIVDVSTPAQPRYVSRWETRPGESKELHGVSGDDKNLYLAYGGDGLVILAVSGDGTPTNPKLVSQIKWKRAAAHRVVRAGRYAFVGEEFVGCEECVSGPRGAVRVFDVSKLKEPVEIARYEVPEAGVDGITVDNNTLYAGFRQGGVRLVDVSGDLRGDIYREGRQVGWFMTAPPDGASMAVSALPFKGYVFVTDAGSGLWVLQHQRTARLTP
ncbi:MAG: hypothetical protein HY700_01210 [Gemmatimonadetes bacterium]|nr:hypothetical protein [Gemmatimonadota bacterium]